MTVPLRSCVEVTGESWLPLAELSDDPERFGNKAVGLARARRRGVSVVEGWVWPVSAATTQVDRAAAELLTLAPDVDEWILRSSSPHEDREGASAAGLFRTASAPAHPGALAKALREVLESAASGSLPPWWRGRGIAVLAQPLLHFDRWATLELRGGDLLLEGWRLQGIPRLWSVRGKVDGLDAGAATASLREILDHAVGTGSGPRLLEIGIEGERSWLLQIRPAPQRPVVEAPRPEAESVARGEDPPGWGLRVHPGDADLDFQPDLEHSPLPLAPLLAGLFGEWIAASAANTTSRVSQGIWHDPVAPPDDPASPPALEALHSRHRALTRGLRRLAAPARACLRHSDRALVQAFFEAWLAFQGQYFGGSLHAARAWARTQVVDPGALAGSAAARRRQRWQRLAARVDALRPSLPPTVEALDRWVQGAAVDPLGRDLRHEWRRCAHLSAYAYDGRGRFWGEDPTPLWREIQRWRGYAIGVEETAPSDAAAAQVLRLGEDDNELLLRSYWILRRVLGAVATTLRRPTADELMDLLPRDLLEQLDRPCPNALARARSRGRALYLQWRRSLATVSAEPDERILGHAASAGRCRGPLWVGQTLDELPVASDPATIAVVAVVTPADAIYFDRIAGLVCEGGDRLGHASILAREFGVPCIVRVGRVSLRLAGVRTALLDADAGELLPLPRPGSDIEHGGRSCTR